MKLENSFTFQTPMSILQKHVEGEVFQNTSTLIVCSLMYLFAVCVQQ